MMQITQPPAESGADIQFEAEGCEDGFSDSQSLEIELTTKLAHPNIVATYKYKQIPLPDRVRRTLCSLATAIH